MVLRPESQRFVVVRQRAFGLAQRIERGGRRIFREEIEMPDAVRRKATSFEEYWLASKAWQRKGLTLGTARALVNAGFLAIEDLHTAHELELATIPRVGPKSLAILYGIMGRKYPTLGGHLAGQKCEGRRMTRRTVPL